MFNYGQLTWDGDEDGPVAGVSTTDLYKYSIQIPYLLFTSYHIM